MQSAIERRQLILEYISEKRFVKIQAIADEFNITTRTVKSDIQLLSCSYPIETRTGRYGGVFAADGWYLSHRYLHDDQEELLRKLLQGLQPEEQKTMEGILAAFAKPKIQGGN